MDERGDHAEQGDIAIYLTLLVMILITSSALVMVSLIAQQGHLNRDVVESERAFGAANSGIEHALYVRIKNGQDATIDDTVSYGEKTARYVARSFLKSGSTETIQEICAESEGFFEQSKRQLTTNTAGCGAN